MKMLKRLTLSVAGAALLFTVTPKADAAEFTDVSDDFWAKDSIEYLASRGVIGGYSDGSFKPNQDITRSQAAAMMVRALDINTSGRPDAGFSDVSDNHPNRNIINAVSDEGIIRGSGDLFRPGKAISRAQMAAVLRRGFELERSDEQMFTDVPPGFWSFTDISTIAANGIATGYPDGTFRPSNKTTRAQFSVFLENTLKHAEGNDGETPSPEDPSDGEEEQPDPSHGEAKQGLEVEVDGWTYTVQGNYIIRTNADGETENVLTPEDIEGDYHKGDEHHGSGGLLQNSPLVVYDGWVYYVLHESSHFYEGIYTDLYRVRLDGTGKELLVNEHDVRYPYIYNDQLFYFSFGEIYGSSEDLLIRADVDGSNREELENLSDHISINGIAPIYHNDKLYYSTREAVYERSLETGNVERIHGRGANELYVNEDRILIGEDDGLYSIDRAIGNKTKIQHDPVKQFEEFGNTLYILGEKQFYSWELEARNIEMIEENMGESEWRIEQNETDGVIVRRDKEKLETHIYVIADEKLVHHDHYEVENNKSNSSPISIINDVFYVVLDDSDYSDGPSDVSVYAGSFSEETFTSIKFEQVPWMLRMTDASEDYLLAAPRSGRENYPIVFGDHTGLQMREYTWPIGEELYRYLRDGKVINDKMYFNVYRELGRYGSNEYDAYLLSAEKDGDELEVIYSTNRAFTFEEHEDGIRIIKDEVYGESEEIITEDGEVVEP